jgi:hypothetical protein
MDKAAPQAATVDEDALSALEFSWGEAYEIGHDAERGYWARRRDGIGGDLTAPGLDELWQAVRADYDLKPVPRDLPGRLT